MAAAKLSAAFSVNCWPICATPRLFSRTASGSKRPAALATPSARQTRPKRAVLLILMIRKAHSNCGRTGAKLSGQTYPGRTHSVYASRCRESSIPRGRGASDVVRFNSGTGSTHRVKTGLALTSRTPIVYGWEGSTMLSLTFTLAEPENFALWEKLVLAALIIASAALFWRRFGVVLDRILKSKKDPGCHLGNLGRRVWDFVSEVMLQSKVIRQRPLPGLAHALVFWGFCAFALVTLNHVAAAFGAGFLSPSGTFGRFYFYFAAVFALACAAGILGLFIRRFFVRPRWLGGKLSYESGVIAFLIFALMVTYLAAFFTINDAPAARILWW